MLKSWKPSLGALLFLTTLSCIGGCCVCFSADIVECVSERSFLSGAGWVVGRTEGMGKRVEVAAKGVEVTAIGVEWAAIGVEVEALGMEGATKGVEGATRGLAEGVVDGVVEEVAVEVAGYVAEGVEEGRVTELAEGGRDLASALSVQDSCPMAWRARLTLLSSSS